MTEPVWRIHDDAAALAEAVADDVVAVISDAIARRGGALVALPGGTTPIAICARIAAMPLDWACITLFPGDDRCVPIDDPLSNLGMLRTAFAGTDAKVAPLDAIDQFAWPPDLVWLGVGNDGHTASIFPGPDLDAALDPAPGPHCIAVLPDPLPPEAPVGRMTLTCGAIRDARALRLVLTGAGKRAVVEQALAEKDGSAFPVGRVLAKLSQPLLLHWCP